MLGNRLKEKDESFEPENFIFDSKTLKYLFRMRLAKKNKITGAFLKRKEAEFIKMQAEIEEFKCEVKHF